MTKVQKKNEGRKMRKERENFIMKLVREHKDKEEKRTRARLNFLYRQVFQYFYDSMIPPDISEVDLPAFIYERERRESASRKAFSELLYRVADKRVVKNLCGKRVARQRVAL